MLTGSSPIIMTQGTVEEAMNEEGGAYVWLTKKRLSQQNGWGSL